MSTEVTAVVENESDENREDSCTECALVELGEAVKDTHGYGYWWPDGGVGQQFM